MENLQSKILWETITVPISELIPANYNPRRWPDKETKDLSKSLERFNLADPLVINKNNTVIGGHFRLKILKEQGVKSVDVRIPSRQLTEQEEKELNLRLNRNLGEWDLGLLADFGEDLLEDVGFDSKELDKIFQLESRPEDDDIPETAPPIAQTGDIWQLGRHRVMCGDSTNREDVEKLMEGKKADMVFTDPPYGMNLDSDYSKLTSANSFASGKKHNKVINDDKPFDAGFLIDLAKEVILFGADYYVDTLPSYGKDGSWMVWDKRSDESQDKGFGSNFEMIWSKQKHKRWMLRHEWFGFFTGGEKRQYEHPTTKPVSLLINILTKVKSDRDNIVLDLFGGSGSTLIACEKTNRICYGMEIDAKYVDVIIKRWEDYTNQKAEKING